MAHTILPLLFLIKAISDDYIEEGGGKPETSYKIIKNLSRKHDLKVYFNI